MSNRNNYYRRRTKATQRNLYKHLYAPETIKDQKKVKYLSFAAIIIPGVLLLSSVYIKNNVLFMLSLVLWVVCIIVVFANAFRKQRKFIVNLKQSGMPRAEFIKLMKGRTKNNAQLKKYISLWDKTIIKKGDRRK